MKLLNQVILKIIGVSAIIDGILEIVTHAIINPIAYGIGVIVIGIIFLIKNKGVNYGR